MVTITATEPLRKIAILREGEPELICEGFRELRKGDRFRILDETVYLAIEEPRPSERNPNVLSVICENSG